MTSLFQQAEQFIMQCYEELTIENKIHERLMEIKCSIAETGTYFHTPEELLHGAKMAWRNSNRCIGRLFWNSLTVRDCRHVTTADAMFQELCTHIEVATNNGKIRPCITIFRQRMAGETDVQIHNHQLIRYAGFQEDERIIGDAHSLLFTDWCIGKGWDGAVSEYTVLPLVISIGNEKEGMYKLPSSIIHEVHLQHPQYDWSALGLKWYAVPIISDRELHIGGIVYTAAPFNGWYMGTEIGARNLADVDRYNKLAAVAELLGLDTNSNKTLWKDEALVQLNKAVLHSFQEAGVSIVDHHTAATQFAQFERNEETAGREVTGRWSWLVPPMSGSQTAVFHKQYNDVEKYPNFFPRN